MVRPLLKYGYNDGSTCTHARAHTAPLRSTLALPPLDLDARPLAAPCLPPGTIVTGTSAFRSPQTFLLPYAATVPQRGLFCCPALV